MPPALIAQAQDETAASVTRILLTFVGVALFCLVVLLTPDVALLTDGERLNVPFAGPVSFLGFIIIGPLVLIALRGYLQIYVEHWRRLESIRRRLPLTRAPTVNPLENPFLRVFTGFVVYLLLPVVMLAFTWKAAVHPALGSGLLCVTVAVVAGHLMLPLRWSWPLKAALSMNAALLLAAMMMYSLGPLISRPFSLSGADLSNQQLAFIDFRGAYLQRAQLRGIDLAHADLMGAWLGGADLAGADLVGARLQGADLWGANLAGADLAGADLTGARLFEADLASAMLLGTTLVHANLSDANLEGATFRSADLTGARVSFTNLVDADLSDANLTGADLMGANLVGANLSGANLAGATLWAANLADADLTGANLVGATLWDGYANGWAVKNLTQEQLDRACGDESTEAPPGLKPGETCARWAAEG